jgi:hypothetical protein
MSIKKSVLMSLTVMLALSIALPNAWASSCSMLSYTVDDARNRLKRAANETDFEDAKDYARRAKSALDDAAMAAMDCSCDMAYSEFNTAASRARRARDADDPEEFVDSLRRAIRSFNSALDALRNCARRRS